MNILVYGAGVLGSLYAARLKESGQNVSILARGQRLVDIRELGIVIEDPTTGKSTITHVNVVDSLMPDDTYDLIMVLVRRNQLVEVLPRLSANRYTPSILFMLNNATGPNEIVAALGCERVLLGFPGAGGTREGNTVRATILFGVLQPTSLGELGGHSTPRLSKIAQILRSAGFPTVIRKNMDAWLKTHAALVSPIANAIYMRDGNIHQLAHDRGSVQLMLQAIREGFQVLHSLDIPLTPLNMRILELVPGPLMVPLLQQLLDTKYAELVIARHANVARDEMKQIADEFRVLAYDASLPTPSIDRLYSFV
ncbi:MAG TPA: 2-dehydropantoate 2-reductase N-terminal domain-containing protein [Anaerolineales bacterium]|nr:2-dehydropantoate 2-reductase N-terminal domain-containing protein [Anaerolineales bacterium]HLO33460.1 2-dehydropantoate 2-reductase N-terminal domain-containing protein [Anaerolineales bacterium]